MAMGQGRLIFLPVFLLLLGPVMSDPVRAGRDPANRDKKPQEVITEEARYQGKPTSFWIKRLADCQAAIRNQAVEALAAIGPEAVSAVPSLIKTLEDDDLGVRFGAIHALGKIGPGAKAAIPVLLRAGEDKDAEYRCSAMRALGCLRLNDRAVVEFLANNLLEKDGRKAALIALRGIGPSALKAALPSLIASMKNRQLYLLDHDENPNWRGQVIEALSEVGSDALPALREALTVTDGYMAEDVRGAAARAIGRIGQSGQVAVADLIVALKDKDESVRRAAVEGLSVIGSSAVPALV